MPYFEWHVCAHPQNRATDYENPICLTYNRICILKCSLKGKNCRNCIDCFKVSFLWYLSILRCLQVRMWHYTFTFLTYLQFHPLRPTSKCSKQNTLKLQRCSLETRGCNSVTSRNHKFYAAWSELWFWKVGTLCSQNCDWKLFKPNFTFIHMQVLCPHKSVQWPVEVTSCAHVAQAMENQVSQILHAPICMVHSQMILSASKTIVHDIINSLLCKQYNQICQKVRWVLWGGVLHAIYTSKYEILFKNTILHQVELLVGSKKIGLTLLPCSSWVTGYSPWSSSL